MTTSRVLKCIELSDNMVEWQWQKHKVFIEAIAWIQIVTTAVFGALEFFARHPDSYARPVGLSLQSAMFTSSAAILAIRRWKICGARRCNMILLLHFSLCSACGGFNVAFEEDIVTRARSMGMQMLVFKMVAIIGGLPNLHGLVCITIMGFSDACSYYLLPAVNHHSIPGEISTSSYVSILVWCIVASLCLLTKNALMQQLYLAQVQLQEETHALDSLFTMVGDISIWLACDGDCILRSHFRLDSLVGQKMEGKQLSELINTEDQQRLQNCLRSMDFASSSTPVMHLSVDLETKPKTSVDLYIVGNAARSSDIANLVEDNKPRYLVGGFFRQQDAMATGDKPACEVPLLEPCSDGMPRLEAMAPEINLLATSNDIGGKDLDPDVASACSLATGLTQGTEEIFAATCQEKSLYKIATLGAYEHWLLLPGDVDFSNSRMLGEGGFGSVVAAALWGTEVAVKVAKQHRGSALADTANELRVFRRLRHPNMVLFYGVLIDPQELTLNLVFELVSGVTLDEYLQHPYDRSIQSCWRVLKGISVALRFMHSQYPVIVHGDIKPSNIMVESPLADPRPKLLDFGLSRIMTETARPLGGSLRWMAPEVVLRSGTLQQASTTDVFSFGRVMHNVLTGQRPFPGLGADELKGMATKELCQIPWPASADPELKDLCHACQCFTPSERPDMAQVDLELLQHRPRITISRL
eukprot:TRINITY_DN6191_c0_g2_i1.p1 TRINITY_DN6191_c0_g2~~TRINITY_DN6191_c0_g2_i1.p1  ORF type:complete len:698 (+),score=79.36 TRINITY_DN6191_c0_g2_i1:91-2184(+)